MVKDWKHDSLASHWKGPYTVVLTSPTAVKVAGVTPWIHHMRVKRAYHTNLEEAECTTQKDPIDPRETNIILKKLYNQLLLQGLAGIILRLTIVSVQRGTCAIIDVECCVYIPDLSGYISAILDVMKGQVKVMSDNNLPFWTLVLSSVKGDWWKTTFTIVIVALCCWKRVSAMTSAFSWQNSASFCPASFCTPRPNLPVTPGIS